MKKAVPEIDVGCAIIRKKGKILIAQRGPGGHLEGCWEFPGGKQEKGETIEDCLIREAHEELDVQIIPRKFFRKKKHVYPEKKITLHFFLCDWVSGRPKKKDCADFKWISPEELGGFEFPPADDEIIEELIQKKKIYFGGRKTSYH